MAARKRIEELKDETAQMEEAVEADLREALAAVASARRKLDGMKQELAALENMVAGDQKPPAAAPSTDTGTTAPTGDDGPTASWGPDRDPDQPPSLIGGGTIGTPPVTTIVSDNGTQRFRFALAMVVGDRDIVEDLDIWNEWADRIAFNPVALDEVNGFRRRLIERLQREGYVFATVVFPVKTWASGIFLAQVDCAPLGRISVRGNRHYSTAQVVRAVRQEEGERFNYSEMYRDLAALSSRPDISIDTKLSPVQQDGRTVVNAELVVRDRLPLHGSLELSNTGTAETGDWRLRTTIQHLNLTKHDDILSVAWLTNPEDLQGVNAFSGQYHLPLGANAKAVSLFGGYSESDIQDVLPELDLSGRGNFVGAVFQRQVKEGQTYDLDGSVGYTHQSFEQATDLAEMVFDERAINFGLLKFSLHYTDTADRLGGRNFISYSRIINSAGRLGSSDQDDFERSRQNADGTFVIDKLDIARLQRFPFETDSLLARSSLFLHLAGQYTEENLPPAIQMNLGGAGSVRGYKQSEASGDTGAAGTVELRLPILGDLVPGLSRSEADVEARTDQWRTSDLQFILFSDIGYCKLNEPLAGETSDHYFSSVGLGLRLDLTTYTQIKLDYGIPSQETSQSPKNGRAHLSLKLQF